MGLFVMADIFFYLILLAGPGILFSCNRMCATGCRKLFPITVEYESEVFKTVAKSKINNFYSISRPLSNL